MGLTNFPNGISSFGTPIVASGYPIGQGNGNTYFCDPANGLDSNDGLSPTSAFDTLSRAHTVMTAGQGDVVYLYSTGQSSGTARQTETLTWTKDNTHIVGVCAPVPISQRARISSTSGDTLYTPFMTISADGFSMRNVQVFVGWGTGGSSGGVNVTGDRNYFENVHFAGMGDQTSADHNDSYSLALTGGGENLFRHCAIGLDTIERDSTGGELLVDGSARRNVFEDCTFLAWSDAATHHMVKVVDASGVDRWMLFDRCKFLNFWTNYSDNMDSCFGLPAGTAYRIYLKDCIMGGIDDFDDDDRGVCFVEGPVPNGTTTGGSLVTAAG